MGAGKPADALGARLVAQVLVAKYVEHTPLYRQWEIYKSEVVPRLAFRFVSASCRLREFRLPGGANFDSTEPGIPREI